MDWQTVDADLAQINTELDAGYPIIVETRLFGSQHFVVLKGHDGTATYFMNDPWYGTGDVTFNAFLERQGLSGGPKRWIYRMVKYHPLPH